MTESPRSTPHVWRARPDQAETVARLLVAFRDHHGGDWPSDNAFLAGVERLIEERDTEFLLGAASAEAAPSGVAQLRFRFGIWRAGHDCLLEDLFVASEARGHGVGRALVAATVDRARERGCRRVELDVNERNETALALYGSFGFSATNNPYGGRDLYMRLHLDPEDR
jgi:GNAT superfamily N-acetyltransferase